MRTEETSEQGDLPENSEPGHRRPYWVVGLALLGLVVVLLAGAFLLERQSRSQVGIEPPPAVTGTTSAQAASGGVQPTAQPAVAPPATPVSASPTAVETVGGLRVANSPLEREIEAAYLHYWDVRSQAYLDLDTSHLPEVMAGAELVRAEAQINQLKAQGRAGRLDVEHRIAFANVSPEEATIYDEYLNRSVFLDAVTKQEIHTDEPPAVEKVSFVMKKVDGMWKVVDGTRYN